jgi:PAS domain S-box-containing protein
LLILAFASLSVAGAGPKEVMLLHSYGREFAPFNTFSEAFRTALAQQLGDSVEFHDVALESARFEGEAPEEPLVDYLNTLFARRRPDLVVPIGGPAARFAQKYRPRLFPSTPMLIAAADQRHVQTAALTTNDTVVAVANDPVRGVEGILQVLPQTTNIVVVLGNSPLEQFWGAEMRRLLQPLTNRVGFTWLNQLSFSEMQKQVAALPPNSAIDYVLLSIDAEGVPYAEEQALARLRAVANAPIFGFHDSQMGRGIVGGPLMAIGELGRIAAKVAARILQGEAAGSIKTPVQGPGIPIYDWRELKRWHISEARLPMGSVIRFRQPTAWEQYKWRTIAILALCFLEALLIVLLLLNLVRRRGAERALRESQERMSLATAAADLGVWAWDMHNNRVWVSANWCRMFGIPPDADIGFETVFQRVHADDREAMELSVKRAIEGEADYVAEYRVIRPDGTQRWIAARGRLHSGRNVKQDRLVGVSVDITERKQAEAEVLRQRSELAHVARVSTMGELAASVAHELNQPLGAILANAEAAEMFLRQDPPALEDLHAILADIRKDDERAGEVIRRMRSLLRKRELERQPLEINFLVEDVLQLVSGDAALRGVALSAKLFPVLPKVAGDRVHLQQVLLNLILNGMDAMAGQPQERRRISVRTRLGADGWVEMAVIDSGHGIEPDKLPRLFEPFYTTKPHGMGMGLSIARTIIEAHGGRIWAENNAAGGAVFRIALPGSGEGQVTK